MPEDEEKGPMQIVMGREVGMLPRHRLADIFDRLEPGTSDPIAINLMRLFGFSSATINIAKNGNADDIFFQYLIDVKHRVDFVLFVCRQLNFPEHINDELQKGLNNRIVTFKKNNAKHFPLFKASLVRSTRLQKSWINIAEFMRMNQFIRDVKNSDTEKISPTIFLIELLEKQKRRTTIQDFRNAVEKLDNESAKEEFQRLIEREIGQEKRRHNGE